MDLSLSALRTVRAVAEGGSFTAAAAALGYTQSAVSRQIAAVERELGTTLFERQARGVRLTRVGGLVLHQVVVALTALEQAETAVAEKTRPLQHVRVGLVPAAGPALLPRAVIELRRAGRELQVSTRDGTTPALVRAIRAGTLDVALITTRPPFRRPDTERPALVVHTIAEAELALAVPATSRHAGQASVTAESLQDELWIASRASENEPQLGVWPGLPGRPTVRHWSRDWSTKLALVAAGAGITTVPIPYLPLPAGVATTRIDGLPREVRRVSLVHAPELNQNLIRPLVSALLTAAAALHADHNSSSGK